MRDRDVRATATPDGLAPVKSSTQILLIEDEPSVVRSIELLLREEGATVAVAETGADGILLAGSREFDIIILDLMLPDIYGYEVLGRLRAAKIETPVLVLSGIADTDSKVDALAQGADDYMVKPFDGRELVARIGSVLRRSREPPTSIVRVGRLVIDLQHYTATVGDRSMHLSPKEFGILELLATRRGEALQKDAILRHLYGGMDEPAAKIVDVFICKLRKKLAAASGGDIRIETIWGFGYVLRDQGGADRRRDRRAA